MQDRARRFFQRGWCAFDHDPVLAAWVEAVRPVAEATLHDPDLRARWLRCGGTWFAGVNALGNNASGAVPGRDVPPLAGAAVDFIHSRSRSAFPAIPGPGMARAMPPFVFAVTETPRMSMGCAGSSRGGGANSTRPTPSSLASR
jgi:hypothetical protein